MIADFRLYFRTNRIHKSKITDRSFEVPSEKNL